MLRLSPYVFISFLLAGLCGNNANAAGNLIQSIEFHIQSDLKECSAIRQVRSTLSKTDDTETLIAMLETTESDEFKAELTLKIDLDRISDIVEENRATTAATALIDYLFDIAPTKLDELEVEVKAFSAENFDDTELKSLSFSIQEIIEELVNQALSEKRSSVSKTIRNPFVICFANDVEYIAETTVSMKSGFVSVLTYVADKNAIRNQIEQLGFVMSDFEDAIPVEMGKYARMQSGRIMGDWTLANYNTDSNFRKKFDSFIDDIAEKIIRLNATTRKNLNDKQVISLSQHFTSSNRRPLSSKFSEKVSVEVRK